MECISLLSVNSGSNSQIILNEIKHITSDNLNLIKNYDEIILNFSYLDCYKQTEDLLKKVEDLDVICIINLKDKYKFCISPTNIKVCSVQNVQSYILDTSTNISKKISYNEEVLYNNLEAIYNNYLFFIKNKLDHSIFNKILSFVDMCLNINDNKYFILAINLLDHLHMKIQKTELSKDDMYEIFNHIKHLSDKFYYNKTCKIVLCEIINKLNNIEFADSLVSELLHISTINITMKKYRFYIKHLYDLLKIDKDKILLVTYFTLRPYIWEYQVGILRIFNTLLIYLLLVLLLIRLRYIRKNPRSKMLLIFLISLLFVYAIGSGDLNQSDRHRSKILPLIIALVPYRKKLI